MVLDAHYYGDPVLVLDRIRAEHRREAAFTAKKEAVRRKKKRRRIKTFMKKLRLK